MSRYKPTVAQIAALRAIATGSVYRYSLQYQDEATHTIINAATVRRLLREELVEIGDHQPVPGLDSVLDHCPLRLTDAGRALLARYGGAS